ncbi:uncharacterized protein LOC103516633 [Diaphorina citri]|uniref:Uncharacterized protein LOC103516633 n=1 Tax=Diaphorina citri TaxID=121845 RepID=A0A3Q0JDH4_DIACI|nr:uncharacterized protein LOC103516633 [Diaphorina citri]XP_026684770.1 uncharacterized protein LOC103516633 [Diaphorina citri]
MVERMVLPIQSPYYPLILETATYTHNLSNFSRDTDSQNFIKITMTSKNNNFKSFFTGLLVILLSSVCLILLLQSPLQSKQKLHKCPQCKNSELLSSDTKHMIERAKCVSLFAEIYGEGGIKGSPLRSVEFRADPVLFRDNFPPKLKRYNDIGSL